MSYLSHSAPRKSSQDIADEIASLNEKDQLAIRDDQYGGGTSAIEDEESNEYLITDELLEEFDDAVDSIPDIEKLEFLQALLLCPELVETESSTSRFLRATYYDPQLAATRLVRYWKKRVFVFGENAFLPLTLTGALAEHIELMNTFPNLFRILPDDEYGRTIILRNSYGVDFEQFESLTTLQIFWYVVHLALENESTQTRGIVMIYNYRHSSYQRLDFRRGKAVTSSLRECLPVRVRAIHICRPSPAATQFMFAMASLIGPFLRTRSHMHDGSSDQDVLGSLEKFGIRREILPASMGGSFENGYGAPAASSWIEEQLHLEMEETEDDVILEDDFDLELDEGAGCEN